MRRFAFRQFLSINVAGPGFASKICDGSAVVGSPLGLATVHWGHEPAWEFPYALGQRTVLDRLKPELRRGGSWRTRTTLMPCIGTMNRPVVTPLLWSPAFRRSGPAKAGTQNDRFMQTGVAEVLKLVRANLLVDFLQEE